jgi:tRNA threonylcarbamoyl adenosine modification protein YjeE
MSILFLHKYTINKLNETKELAKNLAPLLKKKDVITFKGNLGAGKTTFIKFLIQSLISKNVSVTSPTFNLVQIYETTNFSLWHFDMYRIKNSEEVFETGYEQALSEGVSLIEWPENIQEFLPKDRLDVIINLNNLNNRIIEFKPYGTWKNRTK